ncbi:hypothetical protein CISIN_1g046831mg [Citrus sinensis]|uniref:Bifunctional inhibitor/plant lipid transfer protein/seed storage helical domain-containing protein n=1 Tax=Citrus sinensis TaxID=2711 RepID=A0A067DI90_CITSI|nr:hypothetical protein CISIN_1g046831mg [Citrus sinensis]
MEMKLISSCGIALMVLLAMLSVEGTWAQSTYCLNRLAPCLRYLNGSRDVPDSCCDPLKSVIKDNPECLCSMISNKGSRRAEEAGINVAAAQELPGKCGQRVNPLGCLRGSPGSAQDSSANFVRIECDIILLATKEYILASKTLIAVVF